MKYINFNLFNSKKAILRLIFFTSLFASQQAFASPHDFVLTGTDSRELAQGHYDEMPDSIAKIAIKMQGKEYTGTGVITKTLTKSSKGLRQDRAMMTKKPKKHVIAELSTSDGSKLACELNMQFGDIWGQCVNPSNQQVFTIKTLTEEAK